MHLAKLIAALENIFTYDMNLNIKSGTVGYNSKILISDGTFRSREKW